MRPLVAGVAGVAVAAERCERRATAAWLMRSLPVREERPTWTRP
jgi:hypothetical protein